MKVYFIEDLSQETINLLIERGERFYVTGERDNADPLWFSGVGTVGAEGENQ